jgi:1-acyl-sn-glycerol-3-phosphate acyltransferase
MAEVIPIRRARGESARTRCRATTTSGRPCRNLAVDDSGYCRVHGGGGRSRHPAGTRRRAETAARSVDQVHHAGLDQPTSEKAPLGDFLRRRASGDYEVDDFGLDVDLVRNGLLPLVQPLYERWFRVRTLGMSRIPETGPALLVANHSGTIALDSVIMQYAVATEHTQHRIVRNVGAGLVFGLPFIGPLARKSGVAVARDEDALELLQRGELVGVFPEGFKGVGKGWRERYRLQRFGRGGFIQIALRAKVPIVPVAVVGAEEAYPMLGNIRPLAHLLGLPYFPITPTFPLLGPLGAVPLPSKWILEFGEPISLEGYDDDAADDAMLVFDLTDSIRDRIQQMILKNLTLRGGSFL